VYSSTESACIGLKLTVPYAELASGLELAEETLEDAVREARAFIEAIDAARAQ
jgi:hypothetical protein